MADHKVHQVYTPELPGEPWEPGEPAHSDDQGNRKVCSPHAVAKAFVNGFEEQKFNKEKLDFNQDWVSACLVQACQESF